MSLLFEPEIPWKELRVGVVQNMIGRGVVHGQKVEISKS